MAYFTLDDARRAATTGLGARVASSADAMTVLSRERVRPDARGFDIFLSHSFSDKLIVLGVKRLLERGGKRVYVDWIDDAQLDRNCVSPATAEVLRTRLRASLSLIFATSNTSSHSKWMPWELGYFDGLRGDRIAVLPLVEQAQPYSGQEYLGLYPTIERLNETGSLYVVRNLRRASVQSFASSAGPAWQ